MDNTGNGAATARQQSLLELLREEAINLSYDPAVPLSLINLPDNTVQPTEDFIADIRRDGVLVPVMLARRGERYDIVDGIRRILASLTAGRQTAPAMIAGETSDLRTALTTMKLQARRAENLLREGEALRAALDGGLTESDVTQETGRSAAELRRLLTFASTDSRILSALRNGRCAPGVARAAAKLPAGQQAELVIRLQSSEDERITMADVYAVKETQAREAIAELPLNRLFERSAVNGSANGAAHQDPETDKWGWARELAGEMFEALTALDDSGALELKNNIKSRAATDAARKLVKRLKRARKEAK